MPKVFLSGRPTGPRLDNRGLCAEYCSLGLPLGRVKVRCTPRRDCDISVSRTRTHPLIILALETSGRRGSVAVLQDDAPLALGTIAPDQRTAAAITPLVKEQLARAAVALEQIDLVAVTAGPGSFTGLRVGVTTAKTLAYALRCEVLGVDTLQVIAEQVPAAVENVWTVLDAQRQQLFAARFHRNDSGAMVVQTPTAIVDNDAWIASLGAGDAVCGRGVARMRDRLDEGVHVADEAVWEPQAETVGRLAKRLHDEGGRDDFWKLSPQYFRQSAAEEKLSP